MSRLADNRRYHVQRVMIIQIMGGRCVYCSEGRQWLLEFHHTKPRNWSPWKTSRHRRIRRYMQDWLNRECVLACRKCNKMKGSPAPADDIIPF